MARGPNVGVTTLAAEIPVAALGMRSESPRAVGLERSPKLERESRFDVRFREVEWSVLPLAPALTSLGWDTAGSPWGSSADMPAGTTRERSGEEYSSNPTAPGGVQACV